MSCGRSVPALLACAALSLSACGQQPAVGSEVHAESSDLPTVLRGSRRSVGAPVAPTPHGLVAAAAGARTRGPRPVVLVDHWHGAFGATSYTTAGALLEAAGYAVRPLDEPLAPSHLQGVAAFIAPLGADAWPLDAGEAAALIAFVHAGGGALFGTDLGPQHWPAAAPLLGRFGLTLAGNTATAPGALAKGHPLLAGVDALVFDPSAAVVTGPPAFETLVAGQDGTVVGRLPVGAGTVVASGDLNLFADHGCCAGAPLAPDDDLDNERLLLNVVAHLAGR
jgi:hypothetical protein